MDCQNSVELQDEDVIPTPYQNDSKCDIDKNKDCSTFGFDDSSKSDLVLIVEDARLFVSKLVLSLASPVFDKMLHSEFKESGCTELELPGKKAEHVAILLRCIYPNTVAKINHDDALTIMPLVEEYQMFQLKPRCEEALIDSIDADTIAIDLFELLDIAVTYSLAKLRKKCIDLASGKTKEEIDEARKEHDLPPDALVEILDNVCCSLHVNVAELKTKVDTTSLKLEKLEGLNLKQANAIESLEQTLSGQLSLSELVKLDRSLKWQEKVVLLDISICEDYGTEEDFTLWDETFKLSLQKKTTGKSHNDFSYKSKEYVQMELKSINKHVECYLHIVYFVVNKLGKGSNHCVTDKCEFKTGCGFKQVLVQNSRKTLIEMSTLKDIDKGYVKDKKATVVALIYMSEPW